MKLFSAPFIKSKTAFSDSENIGAPIFRRTFELQNTDDAYLTVSFLGIGYVFINGNAVTEDKFLSPFSEYDKLVWANKYNVSHLLNKGKNVIAIILGNGFFNEGIATNWSTNKLPWRDCPGFALELEVGGETVLESDEEFLCMDNSFVTYNQLRAGETFDARSYNENWKGLDYDETGFEKAQINNKMNSVKRLLYSAEPIREQKEIEFVSAIKTNDGYLIDFGINISGYVRLNINEAENSVIEIHHAEEINPDNTLNLNKMDRFYFSSDFMVDRYIAGKKNFSWSPQFTYHGFRYVLIKGLSKMPQIENVKAVLVHQSVERASNFECSDELINWIYKAGIHSSLCNMHHSLTDCPTREKLAWTNDAAASIPQLYINFNIKELMKKWAVEIEANIDEEGQISGCIPAFFIDKNCGPVCDSLLYTLPIYHFAELGDKSVMEKLYPVMQKHYDGYRNRNDMFWLCDWDGHDNRMNDRRFVYNFYKIMFSRAIIQTAEKIGISVADYLYDDIITAENILRRNYIDRLSRCVLDYQTSIAMLIHLNLFDNKALVDQLKERIEKDDYRLTTGMLGLQFIFPALFENNLADLAYKLLTKKGGHTYDYHMKNGTLTLWESWEQGHTDSRNHHMLSAPIGWFFKGFLGIKALSEGYEKVEIKPSFTKHLKFAKGYQVTEKGKIEVSWERTREGVTLSVVIPSGISAVFRETALSEGENKFYIREDD